MTEPIRLILIAIFLLTVLVLFVKMYRNRYTSSSTKHSKTQTKNKQKKESEISTKEVNMRDKIDSMGNKDESKNKWNLKKAIDMFVNSQEMFIARLHTQTL